MTKPTYVKLTKYHYDEDLLTDYDTGTVFIVDEAKEDLLFVTEVGGKERETVIHADDAETIDWRAIHVTEIDFIAKIVNDFLDEAGGVIATGLKWKLEGILGQLDQLGYHPGNPPINNDLGGDHG